MIKRILVGLAGTPFTSVAIQRAVGLGRLHEAEVLGVTVIDRRRLAALAKARGAAGYCRAHGYTPEVEFIPGPAGRELLSQAAEWNADLIVLGNSARSFLLRKVFGETALHVMQQSELPLFLSQ